MVLISSLISRFLAPLLPWVICLLVGAFGGLWVGSKVFANSLEKEARAVRVEVIHSFDQTAKAEVALEEKREEIRTQIKYVTKEIVKYVPATEAVPECRLSFGAVGLLNAARTGAEFQSAGYLDAQIKAATDLGMRELSEADISLAEQYRQLAADHDALVEYAEDYKRRLNKAAE